MLSRFSRNFTERKESSKINCTLKQKLLGTFGGTKFSKVIQEEEKILRAALLKK